MRKVLIVDDNITNLRHINTQISGKYKTILAKSGEQALQACIKQNPDLVLMDVNMPDMDGFETVRRMRQNSSIKSIPVIFLTADHDVVTEIKALESGAVDFITKPFKQIILLHRIDLHLRLSLYQQSLENTVVELEDSIIASFAELIEYRDEDTGGHVQRTSSYVRLICSELLKRGYFPDELQEMNVHRMVRAAPLHDIGKIGVSDAILLKPGRLTAEEFEIMKSHTVMGTEILTKMYERTPTQHYLDWAIKIAEGHHEKFDGSGYPYGLAGEDIPLCSRIMAVADVYDALVSERSYRKSMSHEEACSVIYKGSGTHFDPRIVEVFKESHEQFAELGKTM